MGKNDRLGLAIRTIAVTTRAAILSNEKVGRADLAVDSARRGLRMLDELGASLAADTPADVRAQYERARAALLEAAGASGSTGFAIGADEARASATGGGGSSSDSG